MSNKYKHTKDIPTQVLCNRLDVLSDAVTKGRDGLNREFYMNIPAQVDNDADLVISEASQRIKRLERCLRELVDLKDHKEVFGNDTHYKEFKPKAWKEAVALVGCVDTDT